MRLALVIVSVIASVLFLLVLALSVAMVLMSASGQGRSSDSFVVYRVTRHLSAGDRITERDIEPVQVPERLADAFASASTQTYDGNSDRLGEVLTRPIGENEILDYWHFVKDPRDDLVSRILPGMRLIALPVNADTLPSIHPGMQVDIEAPFAGGAPAPEVLTVIENVQILAVGQRSPVEERQVATREPRYDRTISIQVDPQQATQLSKIQKIIMGPFELHVRPPDDPSRKLRDRDGNPIYGINPVVLEKIGEEGAW